MLDHIMQITTFDIHPGKLDAFKESIRKAVDFTRQNGPQLLVDVFIDEKNMRAHSCQIQADSEAILVHWRISDPYINEVMETCSLVRIDVYGNPNEAVLEGMRPISRDGVEVVTTPRFVGYSRLSAEH